MKSFVFFRSALTKNRLKISEDSLIIVDSKGLYVPVSYLYMYMHTLPMNHEIHHQLWDIFQRILKQTV